MPGSPFETLQAGTRAIAKQAGVMAQLLPEVAGSMEQIAAGSDWPEPVKADVSALVDAFGAARNAAWALDAAMRDVNAALEKIDRGAHG